MPIKISIIGAGSAVFSLGLVRDLCMTPSLAGATVSLMDISPERLDAIHRLCERYIAETGAEIRAEATMDRRESLRDADFVINTALIGGYEPMYTGWEIARELGYRLGGSLHIVHDEPFWINFHQLRFFETVVEEILDLCPNALYLQVANPVLAGVTHLSRTYAELKIVGICHGYAGVYQIAEVLGLDPDGLTFEIPGVNHHVWLRAIHHNGRDVFPLLDEWIATKAEAYWETCDPSDDLGPQAVDLYRRFGVFPIGDTCTPGGGSWPWWYHADPETETRWHEDPVGWWKGHQDRGDARVREIEQVANDPTRPVSEMFPPVKSHEVMVPLIEAVAVDSPRALIGNVLNVGEYVPGIPRDFAVEIPLYAGKHGVQPIQTGRLPQPVIAQILRDRVAPVEIELAAYREHSRERLVDLVLTDPWTTSLERAKQLVERIFRMPGQEAMRAWYAE
jgi:alpha-galactosidase